MRIARHIGLFTAAALSGVFSVFAGEVVFTADEASIEKFAIATVYRSERTEPQLRIEGPSAIQIPVSGGSATVFSDAHSDVKLVEKLDLVGVDLVFRPHQLRYTASIAQVRDFALEFASGSVTNRLSANDGVRVGVGVAGSFVPVTQASVGVGWSLDYRYLRTSLNRFQSDGVVSAASQRFEQDQFQGAVTACWRWKSVSPFGGLKVVHVVTRLTDRATQESVRGATDGVSPVAGLEWTPLPGESLVVEGSLVDDRSLTLGWLIKF